MFALFPLSDILDTFFNLSIHRQQCVTNLDVPPSLDIRRTLEGNKIVDHSDVVGASPVGAALTTSSFST